MTCLTRRSFKSRICLPLFGNLFQPATSLFVGDVRFRRSSDIETDDVFTGLVSTLY